MRRFGGGNRTERKQNIIEKIMKFFEKYFGLGINDDNNDSINYDVLEENDDILMVAEESEQYNKE